MKILHVTECFEGGVSRAIQSVVDGTPEHSHHLLAIGSDVQASWPHGFASVTLLTQGFFQRIMQLRELDRGEGFDIIHAHSSWAGVYSRLLPLRAQIVYQPHCYATEMNSGARRVIFATVERVLGSRRQSVIVLSPREAKLAARYSPRAQRWFVPNAPSVESAVTRAESREYRVVVTAGRLSRQKDPSFYAAVAKAVRAARPSVQFVWIGGGSSEWDDELASADVTVTGWVEPSRLGECLDSGDIYLHTAAWEGFPLSVLDACARRLPIVVRAIPAFEEMALCKVDTVGEAAAALIRLLDSSQALQTNADAARVTLATMNSYAQGVALREMYDGVRQTGLRTAREDRAAGAGAGAGASSGAGAGGPKSMREEGYSEVD